jgi:hypothetical protein
MTEELRAAVERAPGIAFTGWSHSSGLQEARGVWVDAETAGEAVERAQAAVDGLAVYVDAETVKDPDAEDVPGADED